MLLYEQTIHGILKIDFRTILYSGYIDRTLLIIPHLKTGTILVSEE